MLKVFGVFEAMREIEVFQPRPCLACWVSLTGQSLETSILLVAYWSFKLKVLKYHWNFCTLLGSGSDGQKTRRNFWCVPVGLDQTGHIASWPDRTGHPNLPDRSCRTGLNSDLDRVSNQFVLNFDFNFWLFWLPYQKRL